MSFSIHALIESRVSTKHYDTKRALSIAQIQQLVELATRAPSAYNFQNWRFVAVNSSDAKEKLYAASYRQQQVLDAPVTFIICGTLEAHKELPGALAPSVAAGIMDEATQSAWITMAEKTHSSNLQLQRDEAMRSASLAAMTLMLAAQGMGLSTGAMSGFDPEAVAQSFELGAKDVPVMLITVGYSAPGNWPQKPRKPVHEVLVVA